MENNLGWTEPLEVFWSNPVLTAEPTEKQKHELSSKERAENNFHLQMTLNFKNVHVRRQTELRVSDPFLIGVVFSVIALSRARYYYYLLSMCISFRKSQQLTLYLCS